MCGFFVGVFTPDAAPSDQEVLDALASIRHRGPDGYDWCRIELRDGRIAVVGHVRLALVGIDDGRQPFLGDTHVSVVNGELYDWQDRRRELEAAGAHFRTSSDSEVAHASFGIHGATGWLAPLDGEWTAAVMDTALGTVHAACDPFGTKPLRHWTSRDGRSFAVASEAKALFELGIRPELDVEALRFALTLQYLPLGRTLFRGIGMLPPGHRIDHDGRRTRISPWSDLALGTPSDEEPRTPEDAIQALRRAVRRRLPAERSFATHLSGGLDSALVLALASETAGPGIDAFVADFAFGSNETDQARETARHIGANLVPVRMEVEDLMDAADQASLFSEGLSINGHAAAKILIAHEVASRGHRCVLTGEGADEAFWGYEHLRLDAGLSLHADAAANTAGVHRPSADVEGLEPLSRALHGPVPGFVRTKAAMTLPIQAAFGPAMSTTGFSPDAMAGALPQAWLSTIRSMDGAHAARALWNLHGLSGYILRGLDDAMGMSRGIESRLSFLDPAVQRLASTLEPHDHFSASGLEKRLLRDGADGLVPEAVLQRRKAPFMAPMITATPQGLAWARERILGGRLASSGIMDAAGLEGMLAQPATPAGDANLMTLASLSRLMTVFGI